MGYDLEERTMKFAGDCRGLVKKIYRTIGNIEDGKQLVRSSGSVGANYIEANEALSKKDFLLRLRISRKEAKETMYWLSLIDTTNDSELDQVRRNLLQESRELRNILSSIINKSQ